MTSTNAPSNPNGLHQLGGRMMLKRAPGVMFFLQDINIPGVRMQPAVQTSPLDEMPWPGDRLYREALTVSFLVDEDMKNYLELWDWMAKLAAPDAYSQYRSLSGLSRSQRLAGDGVFSDISISITNSAYRPHLEFRFTDCWPDGIGGLRFTTTADEPRLITCDASFKFRHYRVFNIVDDTSSA